MKEHIGVEAAEKTARAFADDCTGRQFSPLLQKTSRAFAGRQFNLIVLLMCDLAEPVTTEG